MSRCLAPSAAILLFSVSLSVAGTEETTLQSYPLPDHGSLKLAVPKSWQEELQQPSNRLPPTMVFTPKSGSAFEILFTPMWPPRPDIPMPNAEEIKLKVENAASDVKPQAVEKVIPLKELKGTSGAGYYFSITDRAPEPDEYKYMTQGILRIGELLATFTILTNDGSGAVVLDALTMVRSASHVKATLP